MHLDVLDLRNFYYRSALGRAAQKVIRDELVSMWPDCKGHNVAGYGFAVPLLRPFLKDARRVVGLMPGPQGVMPWPPDGRNVSVLCEDTMWPVETGHIDRLVMLHGLETTEQPTQLLDEAWRALGPGGRAVIIVPNRAGLWSRSDKTPFGYGRPYSLSQLEAQLRRHHFVIERTMSALYQPPSSHRIWRKSARVLERVGHNLPIIAAGGILIAEISKQTTAPKSPGLTEAVRNPLRALEGMAKPAPKPESARVAVPRPRR